MLAHQRLNNAFCNRFAECKKSGCRNSSAQPVVAVGCCDVASPFAVRSVRTLMFQKAAAEWRRAGESGGHHRHSVTSQMPSGLNWRRKQRRKPTPASEPSVENPSIASAVSYSGGFSVPLCACTGSVANQTDCMKITPSPQRTFGSGNDRASQFQSNFPVISGMTEFERKKNRSHQPFPVECSCIAFHL